MESVKSELLVCSIAPWSLFTAFMNVRSPTEVFRWAFCDYCYREGNCFIFDVFVDEVEGDIIIIINTIISTTTTTTTSGLVAQLV